MQLGQYPAPRHVVAHLSDPHLLAGGRLQYGVVDPERYLRLALDRLARLDPRPQALVFTGDLFASGTISGPEPDQRGSFLELCWGGKEPMAGGRTFLVDGDEVALRYTAPGTGGGRIALGEVVGTVEPARG